MKVFISEEKAREIFKALTAGEGNDAVCRIGLIQGRINKDDDGVSIEIIDILVPEQASTRTSAIIEPEVMLKQIWKDRPEAREQHCGFAFYAPFPTLSESVVNKELRLQLQSALSFPFAYNLTFNKSGKYAIYHNEE